MLHGAVLGTGVKLSNPNQGGRQNQTYSASTEQLHLAACGRNGVVRHDPHRDEIERNQGQAASNCQTFVQGGHHIDHAGCRFDKEAANDGSNDRHSTQSKGVHHGIARCPSDEQRAQHHGGNQGDCIGFKQVSGHTGAIAHVIAHVVGNHGGVARVILWNAGFNFTDQVGTHVSTFGEDAAAQTGEDGYEGRAKGKANERVQDDRQLDVGGVVAIASQEPVKARDTQQT